MGEQYHEIKIAAWLKRNCTKCKGQHNCWMNRHLNADAYHTGEIRMMAYNQMGADKDQRRATCTIREVKT